LEEELPHHRDSCSYAKPVVVIYSAACANLEIDPFPPYKRQWRILLPSYIKNIYLSLFS